MSGGGSFSSDQKTLLMDTIGSDTLARAGRARITSIQAEGVAGSKIIFKSGGSGGTTIATYEFGTEGLRLQIPGSGILFEEGVYLDLTATTSVTITFT